MSLWDGTRWVQESPPPTPKAAAIRRRIVGATLEAGLVTVLVFGLVAGTTLAARPQPAGSCTVSGDVVSGAGLPTDELINFMVTDAGGTNGWVLGHTWEGSWDVAVAPRNGPTRYEFASRTFGRSGSKYHVFASCWGD